MTECTVKILAVSIEEFRNQQFSAICHSILTIVGVLLIFYSSLEYQAIL